MFFLSLLVTSVIGAGYAALTTLSSLRADGVDAYLRATAVTGWIENESAWLWAEQSAQHAAALSPLHARPHAQLGELYVWRGHGQRLWPELAKTSLEEAIGRWLSALERSPADGRIWARAASVIEPAAAPLRIVMAERAMALAPFEPDAQRDYTIALMQHWDKLSPGSRQKFLEVVRRVDTGGHSLLPFEEAALHAGRQRQWSELQTAVRRTGKGHP